MLFGARKKRAFNFGTGQPEPDDVMFPPVVTSQQQQQPVETKPSFFGHGGVGRNIAGAIGDVLSQYGGFAPTFGPAQAARAEAMQRQAAAETKRANDFEDFKLREKYKLDNPAPVNNDTINDFEWYKGLSPQDRATYQQMKPQYRVDPATGEFVQVQIAQPVPDAEFGGWGENTPPATIGVPRPALGANGLPQQLTPAQYNAIVQSLGKSKTDAWVKQYNIRVTQ